MALRRSDIGTVLSHLEGPASFCHAREAGVLLRHQVLLPPPVWLCPFFLKLLAVGSARAQSPFPPRDVPQVETRVLSLTEQRQRRRTRGTAGVSRDENSSTHSYPRCPSASARGGRSPGWPWVCGSRHSLRAPVPWQRHTRHHCQRLSCLLVPGHSPRHRRAQRLPELLSCRTWVGTELRRLC